jgi:uncharacterized membrane protein
MKKREKADKIVLAGKLMRVLGILGIVAFLGFGGYSIYKQNSADWVIIVLGLIVIVSFALLAIGDTFVRVGMRKGVEAQIRRRNEK